MGADRQRLIGLCRDVLSPLIEADDGELYLVFADDSELVLHLGGACSGCPGAELTIRTLIEPAVGKVNPAARVTVSVGAKIPEDSVLIESGRADQADDGITVSLDDYAEANDKYTRDSVSEAEAETWEWQKPSR